MNVIKYQQGIMSQLTKSAIYLFFTLKDNHNLQQDLFTIQKLVDGCSVVLGFGNKIMNMSCKTVPYKLYEPVGNQNKFAEKWDCDMVLWLRNDDQGVLMHQARQLIDTVSSSFLCIDISRAFTYLTSKTEDEVIEHDLSGFEDGTENPKGEESIEVAIISSSDRHLNGGSCWSIQKWAHDFSWLDKASQETKEQAIGRSLTDNRELKHAHCSAHVKRTEQESFAPEALMWRRSMPWVNDKLEGGLMFSSFANSFYPFEVQFDRMVGNADGVVDAVFNFSRIIHTTFLWCPPFYKGKIDLSVLKV